MSYEGYVQRLCKNGHLSEVDCYDEDRHSNVCHHCNEPLVWSNSVDETNCEADGFVKLKESRPPVFEKCSLGFDHRIEPAVYEIPTRKTIQS